MRTVLADPSAIVVVNGVAQGLALLAQVLTQRDITTVGYEDPGSRGTRDQLERGGLTLAPVEVDDLGLDVDALARTQVAAVFTTPAHQYPTGVVLAPPRRRALLDWVRRGGLVIEDDYTTPSTARPRAGGRAPALALEHVVYLGSVSKTLAPALRLGWVAAPPDVREELVVRKQWSDITSPALGQLALAEIIASGAFERHLPKIRTRQRIRRDALLGALRKHLPGAHVHGVAAGLHLLVGLPEGVDDADVAERALAAGVAVQPLSYHRLHPGPPDLVSALCTSVPNPIAAGAQKTNQEHGFLDIGLSAALRPTPQSDAQGAGRRSASFIRACTALRRSGSRWQSPRSSKPRSHSVPIKPSSLLNPPSASRPVHEH